MRSVTKTMITSALCLTALSSAAQALTVSQDQIMRQDGQSFTYIFGGLRPVAGTGATVTLSSGESLTNPGRWDGIDIDSQGRSNEYFELFVENQSFGTFNCSGRSGHTLIEDCTGSGVDQIFSVAVSLTPTMLSAALSDGSLTIMLDFSRGVNHLGDQDIVRAAVTYSYDTEILPVPMSAMLLTTGLASFGALRRRKS